jgi:hypothetical protein
MGFCEWCNLLARIIDAAAAKTVQQASYKMFGLSEND